MGNALYPFSARKHIQDLMFRSYKASNEAARIRMNGGDEATAKRLDSLKAQLDIIIIRATGGVPTIWLTGKEYSLAMDSVRWATEQRGK